MVLEDETRFSQGDTIRVRDDNPPGHHRTPWYIKGRVGRVDACCQSFRNPESRAYGGDGNPRQPLYRIEFDQTALWENYAGKPTDKLLIDVYQHWLEPA